MRWLVCDYGEVISRPQDPEGVAAIAELCEVSLEELDDAYWSPRLDYDRGDIDARTFWSQVARGELTPGRLDALIAADVASWTRLDDASVAAIEAAEARGYRLALLSNAPHDVARGVDAIPWFARFAHRLFSCDLRLTKPEPAIYAALLDRLDSPAGEVVFVDDREDNVAGAAAVGIRAFRYSSPETFSAL